MVWEKRLLGFHRNSVCTVQQCRRKRGRRRSLTLSHRGLYVLFLSFAYITVILHSFGSLKMCHQKRFSEFWRYLLICVASTYVNCSHCWKYISQLIQQCSGGQHCHLSARWLPGPVCVCTLSLCLRWFPADESVNGCLSDSKG